MPVPTRADLQAGLIRHASTALSRLGHSPRTLGEAKREVAWWLTARGQAVQTGAPVFVDGWSLSWSANGYAELVETEVPRGGRGRITVLVHASSVSAGTERAQYLRLPNTSIAGRSRPGYSLAGTILAVGSGVKGLSPGDRVAVVDAPHASVVSVLPSQVSPMPEGISFAAASLVKLAVISGQGVNLSHIAPGLPFAVVGGGIVGAMALRIAAAEGAIPQAVIATSRGKEGLARAGGARSFLTTREDADAIDALALPLVIEATGDPDGIAVALRAAGPGGRVVLLGSPRGVTRSFPLGEVRAKGLELIGAHVDTLRTEAATAGGEPARREAQRFLRLLAEGTLNVDDLAGPAVDPREAALFYRRLVSDRDIVGAHFDWTRLDEGERAHAGNPLRPPRLTGRGMDIDRLPLAQGARRPVRGTGVFDFPDPFAGARGDLRIGMLGCGDISVQNAAGVTAAPNARLVACFDPNAALAAELAAAYGAVSVPTAEALVEHPEVDAVFVSVPHHLHAPLALQAIAAGKHVIVEKPPANDLAGALAMSVAAERAGVTLSVCFPQRYDPGVVVARRLVERGALGHFGGSTVKVYLDKSPAYWIGGFSGRSQSTWRSSREQSGGGVLIMNVCHYIDVVRYIAGVEVDSVVSLASTIDDAIEVEVEDSISVSLSYENGAVGSIIGNSAVRGTTANEVGLWGRDGHVVVEPKGRAYSLRAIDGMRTTRWQSFGKLPKVNIRGVYVSRLATAIADGVPADITAADGVAVQALIEASYRSAAERCAVRPADLVREGRT